VNIYKNKSTSLKVRLFLLLVSSFLLSACSENKPVKTVYQWQVIKGFPKPKIPENNKMTLAKVTLGRAIFHDKNLSANQTQSCESCHLQVFAFGENIEHSVGSTGQAHRRNAPALVNIAYNKTLTWAHDGLTSLERQILLPMFSETPVELGITGHEEEVLSRFKTEEYLTLFKQAFPDEFSQQGVSYDLIVKALASFVRSLISLKSSFDKYAYANDDNAISTSALRGMELFFSERLECHHCHGGFNFTQSTSHEKQLIDRRPFHNTGLYNINAEYPELDIGLAEISLQTEDNGRFRAPTLRNISVSAPYMHDGSIATLPEVLDFYAAGGRNIYSGKHKGDGRLNPFKSAFIKGFEMSAQDKLDLLSFLASLTDESFLTNPEFAKP
jgi:cytochrome c peroxidase